MASIQKRPDGRWRARYRDASRKEHARHFRRKVDAQAWLDEVTASKVTGTYVDPRAGRITLVEYFNKLVDRRLWKPGTVDSARQAVDSTPFRDVPLQRITRVDLESWVADMAKTLAPTTVRTRHNYVSIVLGAAHQDRIIGENVASRVKLPRAPKAVEMVIPTSVQVAVALDAAADHFRPFIAVCAFAGLRLGEAAGLRLQDVDHAAGVLRVRQQVQGQTRGAVELVEPKNASVRDVPAPADLLAMLRQHTATYGSRDGLVLTNGADLWNRESAGHQWRMARKAAGMEEFTLHDLRHYYASALIAAGCDVVTVQRALGHSTPTITLNTYSHLWPDAADRTRAAAEDLMQAALGSGADYLRTESSDSA